MVYSALSIALLLASFDVAQSSEREKSSWIDWTMIDILPPRVEFCLVGSQHAGAGRRKFTHFLQNGMASYTYKDVILWPECLA